MKWKRRGPPSFTLLMRPKRNGFLKRMRPELRRSCPCPFRKHHPAIDLHYARDIRVKFPVPAPKFPVLSKRFPVPSSREFRYKSLNLLTDWMPKSPQIA